MTTPEQLQAWREEFESTINLTHMNQVSVREKMVYFDRELECHWQGYLRRCQETEQIMKLAKFGAMVIESQEFLTEMAVKAGVLEANPESDGYRYTISQSEIKELLK